MSLHGGAVTAIAHSVHQLPPPLLCPKELSVLAAHVYGQYY